MTLIIGCITSDFGIIAGDTQLTTRGLERGGRVRKSIELKVRKYSNDFMMGILGEWGYFYTTTKAKGLATYINEYDVLRRNLSNREVADKLELLNKFLIGREIIKASTVFVKRNKDGFELDSVSSNEDIDDLKVISSDDYKIVFNEPFFSIDGAYVKNKIEKLIQECELNNTLLDMLFLLNNIILEIISNGRSFTISKEGTSYVDVDNTVGGYITIQIMTMTGIHDFNYLGSPYDVDSNCLLDKTTYPFSRYVDNNKVIRYIDNLSMLVRNALNSFNSNVRDTLIALVIKQINYIVDTEILSEPLMNDIISHINMKYDLEISLFDIESMETNLSETEISLFDVKDSDAFSDEIEMNLDNVIFDNASNEVDIGYLLRFFN